MEHVIFALYFHAFTALLILLMYVLVVPLTSLHLFPMSGATHKIARWMMLAIWSVSEYGYLALGLRRFYRVSVRTTLGALPVILAMYVASLLAGVWLLRWVGVRWQ